MKLIIDIPKSIYEYMQTDKYDRHKTEYFEMIIPHSVKDGTPLEKELEKIKTEILDYSLFDSGDASPERAFEVMQDLSIDIIDNHISELKGESE